ncbi:hypothetical protein BASA62_007587 [Batrachochytrium salamandrivorans]|nr:hypothetical protein BASA62_007587 [Batrachochytrium salamandrivorans]
MITCGGAHPPVPSRYHDLIQHRCTSQSQRNERYTHSLNTDTDKTEPQLREINASVTDTLYNNGNSEHHVYVRITAGKWRSEDCPVFNRITHQSTISVKASRSNQDPFHVNLSGKGLHSVKGMPEVTAGPKRLTLDNNEITFLSDIPTHTEVLHISNNLFIGAPIFVYPSSSTQSNRGTRLQFLAFDRMHLLDVSYNNIRRVKYLHRLINLQDLNLECNRLRSLSVSRSLPRLRYINLSFNQLVSFGGSSFPGLFQLNLNGNCIPEIDEPEGNFIGDLNALTGHFMEILDCRTAGIEKLPATFNRCASSLWKLCLSGNMIHDVLPLASLKCLQVLDLSDNKIADIGGILTTLRCLCLLRILDLRENPITEQFYVENLPPKLTEGDRQGCMPSGKSDMPYACTARTVREVCYRSAIISAVGETIEILDLVAVSRQDQLQAKQRMITLKEFMREQRPNTVRNSAVRSKQATAITPHSHAKVSDASIPSAASGISSGGQSMCIANPSFQNWVPQSFPLGDVTADDRLFLELQ